MKEIRYDDLKVGDVISFHGALEKVVRISTYPAPANESFPNESTVYFELEPYDNEAIEILGKFYSHGEYGGIGCLKAELVSRA